MAYLKLIQTLMGKIAFCDPKKHTLKNWVNFDPVSHLIPILDLFHLIVYAKNDCPLGMVPASKEVQSLATEGYRLSPICHVPITYQKRFQNRLKVSSKLYLLIHSLEFYHKLKKLRTSEISQITFFRAFSNLEYSMKYDRISHRISSGTSKCGSPT